MQTYFVDDNANVVMHLRHCDRMTLQKEWQNLGFQSLHGYILHQS